MHKWIYATAITVALAGGLIANEAQAAPIGRLDAAAALSNVEQAQFLFGGRNYCWYNRGWHGPGFYWCGYAFRRGLGWGGGYGWHGWRGGRGARMGINRGGAGVHGARMGGGAGRAITRSGGGGPRVSGGRAAGGHGGGAHGGGAHGGGRRH